MKLLKRIRIIVLCVLMLLVTIFLFGRYGWKLGGFSACENAGIYVRLERNDVYEIGLKYEKESGGLVNADGTALEVGKNIYLDNDIFITASNLDCPIPFTLTFSDKSGIVIAQINTNYDPEDPVLTVTLTADAKILVNGIVKETLAVPTIYEAMIIQYRSALEENWGGQQLAEANLNFMIADVSPEMVGYIVEDLDDNGIPELAIGTIDGDDFYGKLIFDLYTMNKDGEIIQIFSSSERNRYYYAGDNQFSNLGSSSAADSFMTTLKLEGEGLVDMGFITESVDYMQMGLVPVVE